MAACHQTKVGTGGDLVSHLLTQQDHNFHVVSDLGGAARGWPLAAKLLTDEVVNSVHGRAMKQRIVLSLGVALIGLLCSVPSASALPITYGCAASDTDDCNGLTYAVSFDGQFGAQQRYSLWIKTAATYTGNATDVINSVALSELLSSFTGTSASLLQAPGALSDWAFNLKELSNGGDGGCTGGGTNSLCAQFIYTGSALGVPVLPATTYRWQFGYNATGAFDTQAHIKYLFSTAAGQLDKDDNVVSKKVGSLGSWDIDVQDNQDLPIPTPEPGTLIVVACGLLGLTGLSRKL